MGGHPFFGDIVLVALFMPFLEMVILRENYRILSPVTMFFLAFIVLYVLPYLTHFYIVPNWRMDMLSGSQFSLAFNTLRCFLYTFCIVTIPLLFRLSRRKASIMMLDPVRVNTLSMIMLLLLIPVIILKLGIGVGFSPATMLDRAFNPRAYTNIAAALGPLVHIHIGFIFVLLALASARIFTSNKSLGSIAFFILCCFISIIGGTKRSLVVPFIMFVIVWQKMSWQQHWSVFKKFRKAILIFVIIAFVIVLSFSLWGAPGEVFGLRDAAVSVVQYHREAFYLPLVLETFSWSPKTLPETIADTFVFPIPRAIWTNKPVEIGMWNRYFRPTFEPKTVFYHTSTFGCLSEAHLLFGKLGPFIYGIIWAFLIYKLSIYMLSGNSLFKACLVGIMVFWTYMLERTGFLGVNTSIVLLYVVIAWLPLRNVKSIEYETIEQEEYPLSELPEEPYN